MENNVRTIYILLTDTGTLFTKMIKWFTNAPYNHVSLVFDERLEEIYSFGRKRPRNPLIAGFIREDVYHGTYRYFKNTRCLLLKLKVSESEYSSIRTIVYSFENNKDLFSYNLLGLLGVAMSYPIIKNNSYFCSQFVAEVLNESGLHLWDSHPALVTPNDFFVHHLFEFVYEGRLYDYPLLDQTLLTEPVSLHGLLHGKSVELLKKLLPL